MFPLKGGESPGGGPSRAGRGNPEVGVRQKRFQPAENLKTEKGDLKEAEGYSNGFFKRGERQEEGLGRKLLGGGGGGLSLKNAKPSPMKRSFLFLKNGSIWGGSAGKETALRKKGGSCVFTKGEAKRAYASVERGPRLKKKGGLKRKTS